MISDLLRLEAEAGGAVKVCRTAGEIRGCIADGTFAAVLHIEGVEAIDTRLEALDVLHAAGLRSLGPVWSRPNAFAHGVPFDFPRSPDTGPGLTAAGKRLVEACNRLRILIDLSHLNEKGFWDVAKRSDAPLVATHSCAWTLVHSPRNLTDAQLDAIRDTGGIVGVNYHKGFLRADGDAERTTSLTEIVRHARYIADRIGVEHVGLGSDFDGAKHARGPGRRHAAAAPDRRAGGRRFRRGRGARHRPRQLDARARAHVGRVSAVGLIGARTPGAYLPT